MFLICIILCGSCECCQLSCYQWRIYLYNYQPRLCNVGCCVCERLVSVTMYIEVTIGPGLHLQSHEWAECYTLTISHMTRFTGSQSHPCRMSPAAPSHGHVICVPCSNFSQTTCLPCTRSPLPTPTPDTSSQSAWYSNSCPVSRCLMVQSLIETSRVRHEI